MSECMYVYPESLERYITSIKKMYMPRILETGETLKTYKKYWWENQEQTFTVKNIEEIEEKEYYFIESKDYSHCISQPLDKDIYELKRTVPDVLDNNIINHGSYYGYHIKYWLFMKKDVPKYKWFLPFVSIESNYCISDNKLYSVKGKLENGIYKDCRIILERRQLW